MGNEKPMYYSNGQHCDQKVYFEDWESKYTPGTWESSDQFGTLKECCVAKVSLRVCVFLSLRRDCSHVRLLNVGQVLVGYRRMY